jgi:hypothetical protein
MYTDNKYKFIKLQIKNSEAQKNMHSNTTISYICIFKLL